MIKEALGFLFWQFIAVLCIALAALAILYLGTSIALLWHWLFKLFLPWPVAIGLTAILTPLSVYGFIYTASNWRRIARVSRESSIVLK